MRHLPRTTRVLTTHVNTEPTSTSKRVLVVGRFLSPTCDNCDGFGSVKAGVDGRIVTIDCSECVPAPTAGVVDDIEREDDSKGYEAEDLLTGAVA